MGAMAPYLAMAGIQAGGSLLSAMFAPEDQEIRSFSGDGPIGVNPVAAMADSRKMIGDLSRTFSAYADMPVSLPSSMVQGLPTMTGGGLPMPIGVTGKDPARKNPDLLSIPGLSARLSSGGTGNEGPFPRDGKKIPPPDGGFPKDFPPDYWSAQPQTAAAQTPTPTPVSGVARRPRADLMMPGMSPAAPGDDTQQALAAVDLLMNGIMGGGQA
jgi:hypothetical protein